MLPLGHLVVTEQLPLLPVLAFSVVVVTPVGSYGPELMSGAHTDRLSHPMMVQAVVWQAVVSVLHSRACDYGHPLVTGCYHYPEVPAAVLVDSDLGRSHVTCYGPSVVSQLALVKPWPSLPAVPVGPVDPVGQGCHPSLDP